MTIGLDDVVAAETSLSHVDGEAGRLIIAGHDLEELAGRVPFEEVVAMLWGGLIPGAASDTKALLSEARQRAYAHLVPLAPQLAGLTPVELQGVENVSCDEVDGHLKWRGMIGQCLAKCNANGVDPEEVKKQLDNSFIKIGEETDEDQGKGPWVGPGPY